MRRAEISAIKDMSCQKNSKLIKVEGSVFFFSSENGIKTCLERRAPPVPSAPKAAPASVLLCPCILITTLLIFMRLGTQGGLQSVILSLSLSSPPNLSRLSRWVFYFFFFPFPFPTVGVLRIRVCAQPRRRGACEGPRRGDTACAGCWQGWERGWVWDCPCHARQPRQPQVKLPPTGARCWHPRESWRTGEVCSHTHTQLRVAASLLSAGVML